MTDPVLLDLPASIETERLLMRPPRAGDGAMLHAAITESLAEFRRFLASLPWVAGEQSIASAEAYCRTAHANFLARKDLPFLVLEKSTGQFVGSTGLHRTVWTTPKMEIEYWGRVSRAARPERRSRRSARRSLYRKAERPFPSSRTLSTFDPPRR